MDMSNDDKILHCNALVNERKCKYYENVDEGLRNIPLDNNPVLDIEDLVREGKAQKFCPYYVSKKIVEYTGVIFMPYNYLLDPIIRHRIKINLVNSIVVFDEAHNVEKMCEESACTSITSKKIGTALTDLEYVRLFFKFCVK